MSPQQFSSRPRFVEAEQVTAENMIRLANWCDGKIVLHEKNATEETLANPLGTLTLEELAKAYIKVNVYKAQSERHTRAGIGDWIVKQGNSFKVYVNNAFRKNFTLVPEKEKLEDIGTVIYEQILAEMQSSYAAQVPLEETARRVSTLVMTNGQRVPVSVTQAGGVQGLAEGYTGPDESVPVEKSENPKDVMLTSGEWQMSDEEKAKFTRFDGPTT